MTMPATTDVVVVGSGVTGAATAAAVAGRGQRVVLIDKEDGPPGKALAVPRDHFDCRAGMRPSFRSPRRRCDSGTKRPRRASSSW
jgi:glycine/D-amino acid oxidase-like deaminating enzyme